MCVRDRNHACQRESTSHVVESLGTPAEVTNDTWRASPRKRPGRQWSPRRGPLGSAPCPSRTPLPTPRRSHRGLLRRRSEHHLYPDRTEHSRRTARKARSRRLSSPCRVCLSTESRPRRISLHTFRSQQTSGCDEEKNQRHRLNEVIHRVVIEVHGMERDAKLLDGRRPEAHGKTAGSQPGPRRAPADG